MKKKAINIIPILFSVLTFGVQAQWIQQPSGTSQHLWSINLGAVFSTGWTCGNNGTILKTTDNGSTWAPQNSTTTNALYGLFMYTHMTAWACGDMGKIITTVNGGATWTPQTSGTANALLNITTPNSTTGWAIGTQGTIIKTTNNGVNWFSQTQPAGSIDLRSIHFPIDVITGYIAGNNGTILKTTNGGTNWIQQTSGTAQTLRSIFMTVNPNIGFAVGNAGTILKTINAGVTWTSQTSGITDNLYSVNFASVMTGWTCGDNGKILYTTNGGTNWVQQASGISNGLYGVFSIYPDTNKAWICGNGGVILRTLNGGITAINQIGSSIASDFSLSQNYPNPFNPVTNIEFNIPKAGFVKLVVFDAIGREVKTLVSSLLNAGAYKTDFDANGLNSGIYFYKITAGSFTETKKMILVK